MRDHILIQKKILEVLDYIAMYATDTIEQKLKKVNISLSEKEIRDYLCFLCEKQWAVKRNNHYIGMQYCKSAYYESLEKAFVLLSKELYGGMTKTIPQLQSKLQSVDIDLRLSEIKDILEWNGYKRVDYGIETMEYWEL